jgi:hypothetical protein
MEVIAVLFHPPNPCEPPDPCIWRWLLGWLFPHNPE